MTDRGEESLAARLRKEDASVLGDVLRLYGGALALGLRREYVRRMQAADIDDVFNIALARLWRSRKRVDPRRPLRAWFGRIVRNVACNFMKARRRAVRRRQVLTAPEEMDRLPCKECAAPESPAAANPNLLRILWALPFLPPNYRRILLADAAAPTAVAPADDLARELGLSPSTIREYRRRAPGRVRLIIERQEREREKEPKGTVRMRSVTESCKD